MEQKFGKNSILGQAKRPSRAPLRHSQDHQHNPKGRHFRQGLATYFTKQQ